MPGISLRELHLSLISQVVIYTIGTSVGRHLVGAQPISLEHPAITHHNIEKNTIKLRHMLPILPWTGPVLYLKCSSLVKVHDTELF